MHIRKQYPLKPYAKQCVKFGVSRPAAGMFLAPGLGKTRITLTIFHILKKLGYVDELLVVATRRIMQNVWRQEIRKWKFPYRSTILHGPKKASRLNLKRDVRLINFEGLPWLKDQKGYLRKPVRRMLVIDESSKIRHTTTQRFRALRKLLPFFARRYILTGSPVPNGMMNLFGQVYALDLGQALGTYITQFRNQYFMPTGYMGYEWKLIPGAEKQIYKKIKPLVIRFGTDQLDMPPITFLRPRWVTLPKLVRKEYDKLEKDYILKYREGAIVAANAAVASGKLRQIANGQVYYSAQEPSLVLNDKPSKPPPKLWRVMHDEKCAELVELLEELNGEPALISYEFKHDKLHLQSYFATHAKQFANAPFIDGKTKDGEVSKILRKWDKGIYPAVFGHPDSVAHGLNLQGKGGIVIFYALTWNLENYEQFYQRVWRQGQRRRVLVYRICARDTVDEDMIAAIRHKDHNQKSLLTAMSRRNKRKEYIDGVQ